MAEEKLLTIRDVSLVLGVSEKEIMDLAESGALPAYKIGGVYLRFKRHEVEAYKRKGKQPIHNREADTHSYSLKDRVNDFFYFNDFYILSALLIVLMLIVIMRG